MRQPFYKKLASPIPLVLIVVIIALGIYTSLGIINKTSTKDMGQKCPDDYATEDEQLVALDSWSNEFYDSYPGATLSDWSAARHQFWVDNHCVAALRRYDEAKAGNPTQ